MAYDESVASFPHSPEDMQKALRYLARMMKHQPEAKKLVPIFRALKDQIAAAQDVEDQLAEALELAGS